MPLPIVPIVALASVAGLGYLLTHHDDSQAPTPQPQPKRPSVDGHPLDPLPRDMGPQPKPVIPGIPSIPGIPVPAPVPSPFPTPSVTPVAVGTITTATDPLNVRSAPNSASKVVGNAAKGSKVQILSLPAVPGAGSKTGWYNIVNANGVTGWAAADYITLLGGQAPAPSPSPIPNIPIPTPVNILPGAATAVVNTARDPLNIRKGASVNMATIGTAAKGSRVQILDPYPTQGPGSTQGWYNVKTATGVVGWASGDYLQWDNAPAPAINPLPPSPIPGLDLSQVSNLPDNLVNMLQNAANVPTQGQGHVTAASGLNLRNAPSTSGTVVAGMLYGATVTILNPTPTPPTAGAPKGWLNVQNALGQSGWASAQYIAVDPSIHGEDDEGFVAAGDFGGLSKHTRKGHRKHDAPTNQGYGRKHAVKA